MKRLEWEGELPQESAEEYHARDGLSSTQIKVIDESPWHYKKLVIDGEMKGSKSKGFGSVIHECHLEGKFGEYVVMPDDWATVAEQKKRGIKNPVAVEDQKAAFRLRHQDRVLTPNDFEKLKGCTEAFQSDCLIQSFMNEPGNIYEQGYQYWDEKYQVKCRFRPDIINIEKGYIIDLKTSCNASPRGFRREISKYGYNISAAHYLIGANRLFQDRIKNYYFIAQSNLHPFACGFYELHEMDISEGVTLRDQCLAKIAFFTRINEWPGYTSDIQVISTFENREDTQHETEEPEPIDF